MPAKSEMTILAHRGWWKRGEERNDMTALMRAFEAGFGVETDFRDAGGNLVISHDPPMGELLAAETMLKAFAAAGRPGWLAVNIKADGLQRRVKGLMERFGVERYFVFDMSVPDMLGYLKEDMPTLTRQSEVEPTPVLLEKSTGVWLDMFKSDWVTEPTMAGHLAAGKRVALVSPELHKRKHLDFWARLKSWPCVHSEQFCLCTDFPKIARTFFYAAD